MTDFDGLLDALAPVEFLLIGGVAGAMHGSIRDTRDLDIAYRRTDENIARLVSAVAPLAPYLRGAPPGLPFVFDARTVRMGLNFTLTTRLGNLDLLGEVTGGGTYDDLVAKSEEVPWAGRMIRVVDLPTLIHLKRAAGRPKDFEAIAELEILLAKRGR